MAKRNNLRSWALKG